MNITLLSEQIKMNAPDLLVVVTQLNMKHKLGVEDFSNLTDRQYNTIRALLDPVYLVKLLGCGKSDRKYNYHYTPSYAHIEQWISERDINGVSTKEIQDQLPDFVTQRGHQVVGAAMRAAGYESRVIVLDTGKQGRRWFNDVLLSKPEPSFL